MLKAKRLFYVTALMPLLIILGFFAWFLTTLFEGESPSIVLRPLPEFLSRPQELTLKISDEQRGLRSIKVSIQQSSRDTILVQEVKKGEPLGLTGQTGLAGGDHLHFSIMVNGVYVNPIEWWDQNWIEDNIHKKLALVE